MKLGCWIEGQTCELCGKKVKVLVRVLICFDSETRGKARWCLQCVQENQPEAQ